MEPQVIAVLVGLVIVVGFFAWKRSRSNKGNSGTGGGGTRPGGPPKQRH